MATLERYATSLINYLNLAAIVEPCYSYAVQAICGTWLRPCVTVGDGTKIFPYCFSYLYESSSDLTEYFPLLQHPYRYPRNRV